MRERRGRAARADRQPGFGKTVDYNETKLARLRSETATRLRDVCAHFSEVDFDQLVTDVVETRLKFERIDSAPRGIRKIE